jgi:hypothetical protein
VVSLVNVNVLTSLKVIGLCLLLSGLVACRSGRGEAELESVSGAGSGTFLSQLIITYPAPGTTLSGSSSLVRIDPSSREAITEITLLVDGLEIAKDTSAPWEITWNPIFFADGNEHSLQVKGVTGSGSIIASYEPVRVRIAAVDSLAQSPQVPSTPQQTNALSLKLPAITLADTYECQWAKKPATLETAPVSLASLPHCDITNLTPGDYSLRYRAVAALRTGQTLYSPWSPPNHWTIAAPNPITGLKSHYRQTDGLFNVTLSWDSAPNAKHYLLTLKKGGEVFNYQLAVNRFEFQSPTLADLSWQVGQLSIHDHESAPRDDWASVYPIALLREGIKSPVLESGVLATANTDIALQYPSGLNATQSRLWLNDFLVSESAPGAPSRLQLASHFLPQGQHTLTLEVVTQEGVTLRKAFSITQAADALAPLTVPNLLKETDTLSLTLPPVEGARYYRVWVNDKVTISSSPDVVVSGLMPGEYWVSYDVQGMSLNGKLLTSARSAQQSVIVAPPELPSVSSRFQWRDNGYDVKLTWPDQGAGNRYRLEIDGQIPVDTTENQATLRLQQSGVYNWTFARTNPVGQSHSAAQPPLSIGRFSTRLSGSRTESPLRLIARQDGGYWVLATTTSPELYPQIGLRPAPWLLRLDENGQRVAERFLSDLITIYSLTTDEQDNLYAAAFDDKNKLFTLTKWDSDLNTLWSKTFSRSELLYWSTAVDYQGMAIWNGNLVVGGKKISSIGKSDELLYFDPQTGESRKSFFIFEAEDSSSLQVRVVLATPTDDSLFIAASSTPAGPEPHNWEAYSTFIYKIDVNNTVKTKNSFLKYGFTSISSFLLNGDDIILELNSYIDIQHSLARVSLQNLNIEHNRLIPFLPYNLLRVHERAIAAAQSHTGNDLQLTLFDEQLLEIGSGSLPIPSNQQLTDVVQHPDKSLTLLKDTPDNTRNSSFSSSTGYSVYSDILIERIDGVKVE